MLKSEGRKLRCDGTGKGMLHFILIVWLAAFHLAVKKNVWVQSVVANLAVPFYEQKRLLVNKSDLKFKSQKAVTELVFCATVAFPFFFFSLEMVFLLFSRVECC